MDIDNDIIYEVGEYKYKNFIHLTEEEIKSVWQWRNNENIRKFMYNSDVIPFDKHLSFVDSLTERRDLSYWLVLKKNINIGVTNLTSIDWNDSKAELGYYMTPQMLNSGLGLEFAFSNMEFAFSVIGVNSLFGGIDKRNKNAIILDTYLGCKLNDDDIKNINNIQYIRWVVNSCDYFSKRKELNNIRNFVNYMKSIKEFINTINEYAK